MTTILALLDSLPRDGSSAVLVEIAAARGSTPRGCDAAMLVTGDAVAGTIGGGHLEFYAIDVARSMLAEGERGKNLDIPLGPFIGQCCGGHVTLSFSPLDAAAARRLDAREAALREHRPAILVFGLGHTGRALAAMLALLPFDVTLVDDRPDVLQGLPAGCTVRHLEDPEEAVHAAAPGSAFVIFTHSHALDYRLTDAALRRGDAAYVGMIGSATKRRRFESHFLRSGGSKQALASLTCPIGGERVPDKRPEIIACLTAAELVRRVARGEAATASHQAEAIRDTG